MSDFEAVLERLLSDPSFQSALATDPERALAGYQLDAEERELLGVQLVSGAGADRTVEMRATKSGVVGLIGPVATAFGVAMAGNQSLGSAPTGSQTLGSAPTGRQTLGSAPAGSQTLGSAPGYDSFGSAPKSDGGTSTLGAAADATETFGGADESFGQSPSGDTLGSAPVEATDYQTRVDVDGDGNWDAHRAYERADGGVDIHADINRDGVVDFVGHDYDRDGLVDVAEFDKDLDGTLDTRMHDDDGDGWMDRRETIPRKGDTQTLGQAPA